MDSPVFLRNICVLAFISVGNRFLNKGSNHNLAECARVNRLACICYATLRDKEPLAEPTARLNKKISRESFVMPA